MFKLDDRIEQDRKTRKKRTRKHLLEMHARGQI